MPPVSRPVAVNDIVKARFRGNRSKRQWCNQHLVHNNTLKLKKTKKPKTCLLPI